MSVLLFLLPSVPPFVFISAVIFRPTSLNVARLSELVSPLNFKTDIQVRLSSGVYIGYCVTLLTHACSLHLLPCICRRCSLQSKDWSLYLDKNYEQSGCTIKAEFRIRVASQMSSSSPITFVFRWQGKEQSL